MGRAGRVLLALWSLVLLAGFIVAALLPPDPRGYGTHRRLGLPPCTFRALFDIPCPNCGMTTSFSHFVRGELAASLSANAAGFVLACLCALQIPWCWVSIRKGCLWGLQRPEITALLILAGLMALSLVQWILRLL